MGSYDELLAKMQAEYKSQSGFDPNDASDIGIRLKVLASEIFSLYENVSKLELELFPQYSSGKYLDMHAQMRGIRRKGGNCAKGILQFCREQDAAMDIQVPKGVLVCMQSNPDIIYKTTDNATIKQGENFVDINAAACVAGKEGNAKTGKIDTLMSNAVGITTVNNITPFGGGSDSESDHDLRERLLNSYRNVPNGTNSAYYYDIAMAHNGVLSAKILPRKRGRGTVDVAIKATNYSENEAICNELMAAFKEKKEINVDVSVYSALEHKIPVSVSLEIDGLFDFAIIKKKCISAINRFVNNLDIGQPLLLVHLGKAILDIDGIENYKIIQPANDCFIQKDQFAGTSDIIVERLA